LLLVLASPPALADDDDDYVPGELQVELADGVSPQTIHDRYGITTLDSLPPLYLMTVPDGVTEEEFLDQLLNDPDILDAEYSYENETPEGTRQMVVTAVGGTIEEFLDQHLVERIHLAEIHEHTGGDGILVAVIDTGILADHPALAGVIEPGGYDFLDDDSNPDDEANGTDDDGDGSIDEGAGHGTMVAGIVHLVAPRGRILPIRVLDDEGHGNTFTVAKAIRYAVERGADVINLSLGLEHSSMVIKHEIKLADSLGVAITSAAGNQGVENPPYFPGCDGRVLSVAALDSSDVKADFSNWRSDVAVSAPGVGVYAPYFDGEYAIGAGTSFAAPFIAGQCALILALNPSLSVEEVYESVGLGVEPIDEIPGNEEYAGRLGTGRIDGLQTWLHTPVAMSVADPIDADPSTALRVFPNPTRMGEAVLLRLIGSSGSSDLRAMIHDVGGRLVDGCDRRGRAVGSGVYFVRINRPGEPIRGATTRLVVAGARTQ
jgi:subtilisin family serine protease